WPNQPVCLPRPFVHVACGPAVAPMALALVRDPFTLVAFAGPWSSAVGIDAFAFLAVLHELARIAIAVRPSLHALAMLHPGAELALVLRATTRMPRPLRQPVHARACVRLLQLRIQYSARLRHGWRIPSAARGHCDEHENMERRDFFHALP